MLEAPLRDLLATQLDTLEPGLALLDIERHIPSTLGTSGFIDLLAQDKQNHWVLIELKRSDSAARQAIHEVLKYVEGVKAHLGVRDDEIRVLIVSTEWRELLIPFSRFVSETSISVKGVKIAVDEPTGRITASTVDTLPIVQGRALAPWHELNLYTSRSSLNQGIESYDASCKAKGIADYILVLLSAPDGLHERAVEATRASLAEIHSQFGEPVDAAEIEATIAKMKRHSYALYFVPQLMTKETCLAILQPEKDAYEEALELLDGMGEEEALCYLHESVYGAGPRKHRDYFEIGYPAKFKSRLLDSEGWIIEDILRRGAFARNALLSDDALTEEISGATGISGQRFKRTVSVANKAHIEAARNDIEECLSNNPVWRTNILSQLDEIRREHPQAEVDITIFNPSTGIFTLFFAISRDDGILYVPQYSLLVRETEPRSMYFGELVAEGNATTFRAVLDEFYYGDLGALLMTATWGCYESRDTEILERLGLVYRSFRCDFNGEDRLFFIFRNGRWQPTKPIVPFDALAEYMKANERLIHHIVRKLGARQMGGIVDASSTERPLDELADDLEAVARNRLFINPPEICDLCGCAFDEEKYLIDGGIKGSSMWACMCADCFTEQGKGIGWGSGQLYRRQHDGSWLLVAGFGPHEDED